MTYTVQVRNHALKSGRYVGTFDTPELAETYAQGRASRSRTFTDFQVWKGTPRNPLEPAGEIIPGKL